MDESLDLCGNGVGSIKIRAFRIYDGPTEVHKWSLAKKIKRDWKAEQH